MRCFLGLPRPNLPVTSLRIIYRLGVTTKLFVVTGTIVPVPVRTNRRGVCAALGSQRSHFGASGCIRHGWPDSRTVAPIGSPIIPTVASGMMHGAEIAPIPTEVLRPSSVVFRRKGHTRKAMRMTLIAVAGLALATGGCSLRSPTGSSTYSSLQPDVTAATVATPRRRGSPRSLPISKRSPPGCRAIPRGRSRGRRRACEPPFRVERIGPGARSLGEAEARHGKGECAGLRCRSKGVGGPSTPAAASAAAPATGANYDREAAMQNLINGGKSAGSPICNGC